MTGNEPKFIKKNWKKYLASGISSQALYLKDFRIVFVSNPIASVGLHEGCEVTSGYGFSPVTKPQKVDQIFTAGISREFSV